MRSWYLSRIALERRFEQHPDRPYGVYDRRPTTMMFAARIISGCLAFCVFVFGLSAASFRKHSHDGYYPKTTKNVTYSQGADQSTNSFHNGRRKSTPISITLNGVRLLSSDGTELVYQRPGENFLGTVLMLHGCSHSATDFFPVGEHCRECIGLPEELRMTRIALQKGYTVLAVSSTNRDRKCWHTSARVEDGADYERIRTALKELRARGAYSPSLPLFAVGISAGGLFATSLPLLFKVAGVNSIVSGSICSDRSCTGSAIKRIHPPHVFTHMSVRDKHTARKVASAIKELAEPGISAKEFTVQPKKVTAQYLAEAVPEWNSALAEEIVHALQHSGFLNENGDLLSDPRHSSWRTAVRHLREKLGDNFIADESALSEELNRAWAAHEITSEFFSETLEYLEDTQQR